MSSLHAQFVDDLAAKRLYRAYLLIGADATLLAAYTQALVGERGIGNAIALARALNDKNKLKTVIEVEEIRRVGRFLTASAHDERTPRVVSIDGAEYLSLAAAAALLKMMEEPPANVYFLLGVGSLGRVGAPVRSRCKTLVHRVPRMTFNEVPTASAWKQMVLSDYDTSCDRLLGQCSDGAVCGILAEKERYVLEKTGITVALLARL